jgi:hypothetical protein
VKEEKSDLSEGGFVLSYQQDILPLLVFPQGHQQSAKSEENLLLFYLKHLLTN